MNDSSDSRGTRAISYALRQLAVLWPSRRCGSWSSRPVGTSWNLRRWSPVPRPAGPTYCYSEARASWTPTCARRWKTA